MKLWPVLIFSLAVVLFIIGLHQLITVGLAASYWIFMLCLIMLFLYQYQKSKTDRSDD